MQLESRVSTVLLEYAQAEAPSLPLSPSLSLRDDLAIDSLSLVSVVVRLGEELGVDISDTNLELGSLQKVRDLFALAQTLQNSIPH